MVATRTLAIRPASFILMPKPTNILTSPLAPTQTSSKLQLACITTSPSTFELATNHPCQLAVNPARQLPRYLRDFADVTLAYADG